MRILVYWDDVAEAETIGVYLNVEDNAVKVATEADAYLDHVKAAPWDVILTVLCHPDQEKALELFGRVRDLQPDTPIVGASKPGELIYVPQFMTRGLHSYLTRDTEQEFIFLLVHALEAAFEWSKGEHARELAERLRQEVDSVRRLQESVIPHDLPRLPNYELAARYETSQIYVVGNRPVVMAGGDYYDVFTLDDNKLVFLVGDASGHGMKACMSIMTMHTLIRLIREQRYQNTAQFVAEINRRLCENNIIQDEGGFITLLYCILDVHTHRVQWTSAGHPMPLLQSIADNSVIRLGSTDEGGPPLGISKDLPFDVCEAQVPPDSRIILYTDGLAEAFPEDEKEYDQFGESGIIQTLKENVTQPLSFALEQLFIKSNAFTKGGGRHDDTSVVLVERKH